MLRRALDTAERLSRLTATTELPSQLSPFYAPLVMLAGALNCFLGYRVFKLMLALYGLAWGGALGLALAAELGPLDELTTLLLALASGALCAWLSLAFYFVGVFLIGASAGALATHAVAEALVITPPLAATVAAALVVGVLALQLQRALIILSTAFSGAWITLIGLGAWIRGALPELVDVGRQAPAWPTLEASRVTILIVWLALAIVGVMVQLSDPRPRPRRRL